VIVKCNRLIQPITKKELDSSPWLNIGTLYPVLALEISSSDGMTVFIQTESYNEPRFIYMDGFEMISQKMPSIWVTEVVKNEYATIITMLPRLWNYESFFEDLDDQKQEALDLFESEAEKIYKEYGIW